MSHHQASEPDPLSFAGHTSTQATRPRLKVTSSMHLPDTQLLLHVPRLMPQLFHTPPLPQLLFHPEVPEFYCFGLSLPMNLGFCLLLAPALCPPALFLAL